MICVITRLVSKSFNICGEQTLGISPVDDDASPYYGRIPIPPVVDAQLDALWMAKMNQIQKRLLSGLKKKIMGRKREDWFFNFLTIFILIANLEFIYRMKSWAISRFIRKV
jgi:hypothetical protein